EHTVYDHFRDRPSDVFALRATARRYARITVISDAVRNSFPHYLAKRMEVVPNPVASIDGRADPVGGRAKRLLNVGRLAEEKHQRTLIEAFARIAAAHPSWTLRIVGQGPLKSELEELIEALALQKRVQLAGVIEDME